LEGSSSDLKPIGESSCKEKNI